MFQIKIIILYLIFKKGMVQNESIINYCSFEWIFSCSLGAFGAHGLEGKISEQALKTWEKAVHYQMFHTISILITGLAMFKIQASSLVWAGWLFVLGILLFSGSLYVYSASGIR